MFFYDTPERFTDSVNKLCDELDQRVEQKRGVSPVDAPRIAISGCPMAVPNWKLPAIIEATGAVIVGEESCIGERGTRHLVSVEGDTVDELVERLVDRYFDIDCAVFTPNPTRAQHALEIANAANADGVIHYSLQFCGPYQTEAPLVVNHIKESGLPVLTLETDYGQGDIEQLRTRVEAFVEQLRG